MQNLKRQKNLKIKEEEEDQKSGSESSSSEDKNEKEKYNYSIIENDENNGEDAKKELQKIFSNIFGTSEPISIEDVERRAISFRQAFPIEELREAFKEWDIDGNGKLDQNEFVDMVLSKTKQNKTDMKSAFSVLDRNKTGILSAYDLRHMLLSIGEYYTIEEITEIIKDIDNDGDGFINFDEFLKMMNEELNN